MCFCLHLLLEYKVRKLIFSEATFISCNHVAGTVYIISFIKQLTKHSRYLLFGVWLLDANQRMVVGLFRRWVDTMTCGHYSTW